MNNGTLIVVVALVAGAAFYFYTRPKTVGVAAGVPPGSPTQSLQNAAANAGAQAGIAALGAGSSWLQQQLAGLGNGSDSSSSDSSGDDTSGDSSSGDDTSY